ncbi:winged helix-turn-helix domain-containing protein [Psychromonas ossibalaenae]|uniref:winged helix-turn-helix domain-containing protein n=1 Tax=Psychromonas ossibalaenae TaxID=444922 RepID=UPI0003618DE2|nr:winged helix-turn-helix domain-containing protein [Psychromonas ossibalaenae]
MHQPIDFKCNKYWINNRILVDPVHNTISLESAERIEPQLMLLLEILVVNQEQVVSREEIFEQVWPGVVVTQNSLNQSISKLRKFLGEDHKSPQVIKTVPRQGYRFVGVLTKDSPSAQPAVSLESNNQIVCESEQTDPLPVVNKKSWFVKPAAVIIAAAVVVTLMITLWPKKPAVVMIYPAPVLSKQGELPADPLSYAITGYLYAALKGTLKETGQQVFFDCSKLKMANVCPNKSTPQAADIDIRIQPLLRYSGDQVKLFLTINESGEEQLLDINNLSMETLDEELDDLIIKLTSKLSEDGPGRDKAIAEAIRIAKQAPSPAIARYRMQLVAYVYTEAAAFHPTTEKMLSDSLEACTVDCPLVKAAMAWYKMESYMVDKEPAALDSAIYWFEEAYPLKLNEVCLGRATANALSGNYVQAEQQLGLIGAVSMPAHKLALKYFLDKKQGRSVRKPKNAKGRISRYLVEAAAE